MVVYTQDAYNGKMVANILNTLKILRGGMRCRGYKKIKVRLWRRTWPRIVRDMMDELSLYIKQIACQKS